MTLKFDELRVLRVVEDLADGIWQQVIDGVRDVLMTEIVIRVRDKRKAQLLRELLSSLDFVELVESNGEEAEDDHGTAEAPDFFDLAGIWAQREVDLDSIRRQAWPRR